MSTSAFGVDHGDISKGAWANVGNAFKSSVKSLKKPKPMTSEQIRVAQTENNLRQFSSKQGRQTTKPPRPGQLSYGPPGQVRGIGPMPRGGPYKKG